jgi:hypothetical protein
LTFNIYNAIKIFILLLHLEGKIVKRIKNIAAIVVPDIFQNNSTLPNVGRMKPGDRGWVSVGSLVYVVDSEPDDAPPFLYIEPLQPVYAIEATGLMLVELTQQGFSVRVPRDFRSSDVETRYAVEEDLLPVSEMTSL